MPRVGGYSCKPPWYPHNDCSLIIITSASDRGSELLRLVIPVYLPLHTYLIFNIYYLYCYISYSLYKQQDFIIRLQVCSLTLISIWHQYNLGFYQSAKGTFQWGTKLHTHSVLCASATHMSHEWL